MQSIFTELALNGSKNECARTDNVFYPISEVCDGTVSLIKNKTRDAGFFYLQTLKESHEQVKINDYI